MQLNHHLFCFVFVGLIFFPNNPVESHPRYNSLSQKIQDTFKNRKSQTPPIRLVENQKDSSLGNVSSSVEKTLKRRKELLAEIRINSEKNQEEFRKETLKLKALNPADSKMKIQESRKVVKKLEALNDEDMASLKTGVAEVAFLDQMFLSGLEAEEKKKIEDLITVSENKTKQLLNYKEANYWTTRIWHASFFRLLDFLESRLDETVYQENGVMFKRPEDMEIFKTHLKKIEELGGKKVDLAGQYEEVYKILFK